MDKIITNFSADINNYLLNNNFKVISENYKNYTFIEIYLNKKMFKRNNNYLIKDIFVTNERAKEIINDILVKERNDNINILLNE